MCHGIFQDSANKFVMAKNPFARPRAGIARVDGLIEREKRKIKGALTELADKSKSN